MISEELFTMDSYLSLPEPTLGAMYCVFGTDVWALM